MKHEQIPEAIKEIAEDYQDTIMSLFKQAVAQGAIFGSVHMDVGNAVRRDLMEKITESPEFRGGYFDKEGLLGLAEKEWPEQMISLESITLANGNKWLPNFDAKSAKEAFMAGVLWHKEISLLRLKEIFQDRYEGDSQK